MKIDLIINTADTDVMQLLRERTAALREQGHDVEARVTFENGDATRFARDAVDRGSELVVSAGGDGTLNEVVNGILPPVGTPPPEGLPRLGIVPLGTGNDFAAFAGVSDDPDEALSAAIERPGRPIDLGVVNGRYFVNVSSGGLGAAATEETPDRAKRLLGSAAYLVTGARTFATLEPVHARFTARGETIFEGPLLFFAVGNGARAGGGNWITPRADLGDGLLDLCIVGEMGRAELLRILPELRAGDHLDNEHVIYRRVADLVVEPLSELTVNVDGEPIDATVLEYSVLPGAIRLAAG